ncbi:copper homeostasis protein CutC [uncultured Sphaerochaeta sp.]|uniref:copper homeostasis protein CutC n=1 Tax=uncultured Sphaerochaeta sp. TaxID=886478 RepID=UPI002A0A7532|nr:copper homeostasis protein CutC [uncultured Sphaerochaeta sp.]
MGVLYTRKEGIKIEICLESAQSVIEAEKGGADRIEFCSDLFEGGLTPTLGSFRIARKHTNIPMNVMIRPRGGDFCYSDIEFETMLEDVRIFKAEGANAIVFGILTPDGEIDVERSKKLIDEARPLSVTFHRAFDMTRDAFRSLHTLINLGVDRVLTSGLEPTVPEGADLLAELVQEAGDKIVIMPGCGISERNFLKMQKIIGAKEYHVFLPSEVPSAMQYHPQHIYMGGTLRQNEFTVSQTDAKRVGSIKAMV